MKSWLFLHFVIGSVGAWLARQYALRRDLIDLPGDRRSHSVPTPRGGGIAIVISLLVAGCVIAWRNPQQIVLVSAFMLALLLVAGIGMVDDHRPLSPWLRLGVQALAAFVMAFAVAGTWGSPALALFAFAAVLVLVNVWNFMDGINGLAASQAVLVGGGLSLLAGSAWGWLGLALVAAGLGFLPFNFPRARIFLGDVGSGALGLVLATLLVVATAGHPASSPLLALPFSAFMVDSGLTLARRIVRGERWWTPHTQHAYQRWAAAVSTHAPVTLAYAGWTVLSWLLSWWLWNTEEARMVPFSLVWLIATALGWLALQYAWGAEAGRLRTRAKTKMDKE